MEAVKQCHSSQAGDIFIYILNQMLKHRGKGLECIGNHMMIQPVQLNQQLFILKVNYVCGAGFALKCHVNQIFTGKRKIMIII